MVAIIPTMNEPWLVSVQLGVCMEVICCPISKKKKPLLFLSKRAIANTVGLRNASVTQINSKGIEVYYLD